MDRSAQNETKMPKIKYYLFTGVLCGSNSQTPSHLTNSKLDLDLLSSLHTGNLNSCCNRLQLSSDAFLLFDQSGQQQA